jgi:hypothetical protein
MPERAQPARAGPELPLDRKIFARIAEGTLYLGALIRTSKPSAKESRIQDPGRLRQTDSVRIKLDRARGVPARTNLAVEESAKETV